MITCNDASLCASDVSRCILLEVGQDPNADSLYVVYVYFLNRPAPERGAEMTKFVYTTYLKSQATPDTLNDIWSILLWELQALQHGRKALLGQEKRPLLEQRSSLHLSSKRARFELASLGCG